MSCWLKNLTNEAINPLKKEKALRKRRKKEQNGKSQVWKHKMRLQGGSWIGSAALGDLSIHLLWLCSNEPNNTPFLFYSTRLSLCWVAQQNYVHNNNYQSKLWSKKLRLGKLLTRISSTSQLSVEGAEREDLHSQKPQWLQQTHTDRVRFKKTNWKFHPRIPGEEIQNSNISK